MIIKYEQQSNPKRVMSEDEWIRAITAIYKVSYKTAQYMFTQKLTSGELLKKSVS